MEAFLGSVGSRGGSPEREHRRDSAVCNRDRARIPGASFWGLAEGTPCPGWSVPMRRGLTRVVGDTECSGSFRLATTARTHPRVHVRHRVSAGESGPRVLILDWPDTSGELCCLASVSLGSSLTACPCSRRSGFLSSSGKEPRPVAGASSAASRPLGRGSFAHSRGPAAPSSSRFRPAVQTQAGACSWARPLL